MGKKVTLGILFLIVGGIVGFWVLASQQNAEISDTLSSRTKEFMEKRQQASNDPLFYANVNEKEVSRGSGDIRVDQCFRMRVPFPIKFVRRDGECDYTLGITRPRGNIIAYQRSEKIQSVDQVPGVGMRRQSVHAYKESKVATPLGTFLVFEKTVDGYEKNAFYYDGSSTYIVVNMLGGSESNASDFESLLDSITRL
jgi:hypothetical protein